jgi:apolipoprotein N-acyltransferase
MRAALAAVLAVLAAFVFCALASAAFRFHPAVTGPAAAVCAAGLVACGVWLNRKAGAEDDPEERPPCPYEICHHNHPELHRRQGGAS